jgi:hypothetical protein
MGQFFGQKDGVTDSGEANLSQHNFDLCVSAIRVYAQVDFLFGSIM